MRTKLAAIGATASAAETSSSDDGLGEGLDDGLGDEGLGDGLGDGLDVTGAVTLIEPVVTEAMPGRDCTAETTLLSRAFALLLTDDDTVEADVPLGTLIVASTTTEPSDSTMVTSAAVMLLPDTAATSVFIWSSNAACKVEFDVRPAKSIPETVNETTTWSPVLLPVVAVAVVAMVVVAVAVAVIVFVVVAVMVVVDVDVTVAVMVFVDVAVVVLVVVTVTVVTVVVVVVVVVALTSNGTSSKNIARMLQARRAMATVGRCTKSGADVGCAQALKTLEPMWWRAP